MEEELPKKRSVLKQKQEEVESLTGRVRLMEEELQKTRSDLEQRQEEVESLSHSVRLMEEELQKTRVTDMEHSQQQQQQYQDPRMRRLEEELQQTRSALLEKDEELKSFKDRVAGEVALSMKTGRGLESMNSPVSQSRLKEMFVELWRQWPKVKKHLKSNKEKPQSVKALIQEQFEDAMKEMEEKKKQIDEMFGLKDLSSGSAFEKVQQHRQSTVQNLQLALYHSRREDAHSKTPSTGHKGGEPLDVKDYWSSKCYWLGCLMALNNPPLQPDWENHVSGMDPWDFFPQSITAAPEKEMKQTQHRDQESMFC